MKFTLEIELGDDAMRRYDEIVRAIDYAPFHSQRLGFNLAQVGDGGILRDGNGKTVGKWAVTPSIGIEGALQAIERLQTSIHGEEIEEIASEQAAEQRASVMRRNLDQAENDSAQFQRESWE